MHPVLFQFGSFTIYTYGVLVAAGVLLGLWYARRQAPRTGLDPDRVWNLGIYAVLAALILAKVWLVFTALDYYLANPREIFSMAMFQSGGTFYGGIIGANLTIILYAYFQKMPILPLIDTYAAAMPLGHLIGRLGCFAAGCCYGKPTTLPWGVTFTNPLAARLAGTPLGIPLHPTQLYEVAVECVNLAILIWLGARRRFTGEILGAYLMLYGVERGTIEFLRGDPGRTLMLNGRVSLMQFVSVGFILLGAFLWWRGLNGRAPLPSARPARAAAGR
ncbi:MAG: prolipoprotein diacylglyceryl transferase [Candidatus Acidiferrales bacterium]